MSFGVVQTKRLKTMAFGAVYTRLYARPQKEDGTMVLHTTVAVSLRYRKFSKNAVPDLKENIGGSTE